MGITKGYWWIINDVWGYKSDSFLVRKYEI